MMKNDPEVLDVIKYLLVDLIYLLSLVSSAFLVLEGSMGKFGKHAYYLDFPLLPLAGIFVPSLILSILLIIALKAGKIDLDFKMHMAIVPTNVIFAAFRQMKNKIEQIRMRRFYTTFVLANSVLSIGVSCYWGWTVPMKPKEFEQMIDYMKQTNNTKGLDYALNHKSFYNFWPLPPCRFNHHLFTLIFLAVSTLSAFTSLVELCLSVCQITFVNWVFNKSTDTR